MSQLVSAVRLAWPRNTAKELARAMGVSIPSAKRWLSDGPPVYAQRPLAEQLLRELDDKLAELAAIEPLMHQLARGAHEAALELGRSAGRSAGGSFRSHGDKPETRRGVLRQEGRR